MSDNSSSNKSAPSPDDPFNDMPDRYIPDNFDEIMQRIYEHGVVERKHHIEQGLSEQDYLQTVANTITAPSVIIELQQHGGPTWVYGSEFGDTEQVVVVPKHIIPGHRDPTSFDVTQSKRTLINYFGNKLRKEKEHPRVLFNSGLPLSVDTKQLASNTTQPTSDTLKSNEVKVQQPASSEPVPAVQPVAPTNVDNQSTSVPVVSQTSSGMVPSIDPQKSVPAEHAVNSTSLDAASVDNTTSSSISAANSLTSTKESISPRSNQQISNDSSTQPDMVSTALDGEATAANLQSSAHIDTSVDHDSIVASSQPVAEPVTSHDVETASVDTADINAVDATDESLSASGFTSAEAGSVSDATFDSLEAGSIEAVEMDTPGTDELPDAGEHSLEAGDQSAAVDVSSAELAAPGEEVYAEDVSDLETGAFSAEEDDSPSALDVVAYEAIESGEISLDGVLSDDDVGAEDVASGEDNGELDPDFLSGDESSVADQIAATESVDGAQDAHLSDAEMDDGDEVGVESEAGVDGELGAESDASDVPSSDLSLENSEESAEVDDGSLDVDEQAAVEDVAALEDAAGIGDEGDVDLDAVLSAEPAMEDQSGVVDSDDDELDFVSEAEIAELEASVSDSNAALDDDFMSEDEQADMAVQDSPSTLDDTSDLQDDFLDTDDTDIDNTDDDFLSMDDLAVDEEDLPDSAVDAGDELGFNEPADVGLDADNDGLDIDADATDIDADDDDDVSESGGFSL